MENVASLLQECSDMIRGREREILWTHLMLIKIGWFFQKPFAKNKNKNKVFLYWCCIEPYSSFIGLDKNFRNTWYLRVSKILLKFCGVCCDLWCFVKQRRRNGKKLIKTSFRYCLKLSKSYLCKFLLHLFDLLPQHILDKCPVQYGIAPKEKMFDFNFFSQETFFQLLLHVDPAALPPDLGGSLDYDHTR